MSFAAADIGGTFTDIVLVTDSGELRVDKRLSTRQDYAVAVAEGLGAILGSRDHDDAVRSVRHATTVGTNAVLERRGALTALVTTRGFRDVLEIGRLRTPRLYDITWTKPRPLVPRRLRLEVPERIAASGEVTEPLDEAALVEVARRLRSEQVEAVAVCFINAYVNDEHERRAAAVLSRELGPGALISISSEVMRELREFERTSTTVVDAYIKPVMQRYLDSLGERLGEAGMRCPVLVMQSNGGVLALGETRKRPVYAVESGPAAGVIAARELVHRTGRRDAIAFDMGGTTAKASLIENGEIAYAPELEVGGEISRNSRLIKGSGFLLRTPAIDIAEVGAGGGSIAWIDGGGGLRVGPQSAGASPGPACYGLGGREPTVTDANLVLGYLSPAGLAGGAVPVSVNRAREAIEASLRALGLELDQVAYGIHEIANASMARAIRSVSTERGRDVRQFDLVAFGGSGPLHAASLAREFDIDQIVVPPSPGLFSAIGLLHAAHEQHFVHTLPKSRVPVSDHLLESELRRFQRASMETLSASGTKTDFQCDWHADLRYLGQGHDLRVRIEPNDTAARLSERFSVEHRRQYGHDNPDAPIEVMNLRLVARAERDRVAVPAPTPTRPASRPQARACYFGPSFGRVPTTVLASRFQLDGAAASGPLVIEEYDTAIVVPPDFEAAIDEFANVTIRRRRP